MPGRLFLTSKLSRITEELGVSISGVAAFTPRHNISPGQDILVLTSDGLTMMRWGMIPVGRVNARGRPVMETIINARSETVFDKSAFSGVRRCVVPADGWYEWTNKKRRKKPWRITAKSGGILCFAAIFDVWSAPGGRELAQVATVTCPPSKDVEEVHDRMGVLLELDDIESWLSGDEEAARSLLQVWPAGRLKVGAAEDVDWSQP
ncbi:MAG: SOS response-associated peptidase [Paracoccaceae bacterium]